MWIGIAIFTTLIIVAAAVGPYMGLYGEVDKEEKGGKQK